MRILFFGTYDETTHPRVRVLREGLMAAGATVEVCNVPLGLSTAARVELAQHPQRIPTFVAKLAVTWARLLWRSRGLRPDVVVVGYLGHFDVHLARARFRRPIALDHMVGLADTVRDRSLHESRSRVARLLEWLDRRALRAASVVLVDTDEQRAVLPHQPHRVVVVPVGAPNAWFDAGDGPAADDPLRVVFFGLFTPLQGAPTVGAAAAALATRDDIELTMIGTGQDLDATRAAAGNGPGGHIEWIEWIDSDALPTAVAAHDVCLGIFGDGEKAARVVPNKAYQGAAAGCLVVTSATPCQQAALGELARYVPPADASALARELESLACTRDALRAERGARRTAARDRFAPEAVVRPLVAALEDLL
jgi:glycosyltransferase involved in cell wall biosynthesis